jgi:regulatory protein
MPIVTSIKPQKNKKRVNVYLDGKFSFGLGLETYMKSGLKVGNEISEEEVKKLLKGNEFNTTYEKLLRFATLRPRSRKEVGTWFKKHKVHLSLQKDLVKKLEHLELLDDGKFAKWWVEQRLQFRKKSKRELVLELRSKGVDKNTIADVLSETEVDEYKTAKDLLEKKKYRWEKFDDRKKRQKMTEYLARRGFSWDVIKSVVKEFGM